MNRVMFHRCCEETLRVLHNAAAYSGTGNRMQLQTCELCHHLLKMTCTFSTHRSQAFSPALLVLNTLLGALAEKQRALQTHIKHIGAHSL